MTIKLRQVNLEVKFMGSNNIIFRKILSIVQTIETKTLGITLLTLIKIEKLIECKYKMNFQFQIKKVGEGRGIKDHPTHLTEFACAYSAIILYMFVWLCNQNSRNG